MDTLMIRKLLKAFPCFKGVFPCDELPYHQNLPLNIIVNTDPSYKPGTHWICISIKKNGEGFYFDSFGLPPLKKEIVDFLVTKCKRWRFNQVSLQNITSKTCGHYCVLFIIFKCQNLTNENFISQFKDDTIENDKKMLAIFKNFSLAKKYSWGKH